jgi:hypothetical protein
LLILSFALGGCAMGASAPPPDMSAQMAQGCENQLDQFLSTNCTDEAIGNFGSAQVSAPIAQQGVALKSQCGQYPSVQPKIAKVDACVTKIQSGAVAAHDAQQARIPEAKKKEPQVRADPKYTQLLDRFKKADHESLVAFDNVETAKKNGNPNVSRYELRLEDARKERAQAEAHMMDLFKKYGIEPSDAHEIGLW